MGRLFAFGYLLKESAFSAEGLVARGEAFIRVQFSSRLSSYIFFYSNNQEALI
jgi:hypothetical protein